MKEENWSIQATGSSRLAANVSCLGWPDQPITTKQFLSVWGCPGFVDRSLGVTP